MEGERSRWSAFRAQPGGIYSAVRGSGQPQDGGGLKRRAMLAGGRLHRKIQKAMGADYRAEVSLKCLVRRDELSFLVEGRADGILSGEEEAVIDEIKCIYMDVGRLSDRIPFTWPRLCAMRICTPGTGTAAYGRPGNLLQYRNRRDPPVPQKLWEGRTFPVV